MNGTQGSLKLEFAPSVNLHIGIEKSEKPSIGKNKITHGLSYTKVYRIWWSMNQRCHNPNIWNYKNYGGRGIRVCDEWRSPRGINAYFSFLVSSGWYEGCGLDVDRINNNLGYCPSNTRLASRSINLLNTRIRNDNTSGYRGVTFYKARNNFCAGITLNKKFIFLGYHPTAIKAVVARDRYILENNVVGAHLQVLEG